MDSVSVVNCEKFESNLKQPKGTLCTPQSLVPKLLSLKSGDSHDGQTTHKLWAFYMI